MGMIYKRGDEVEIMSKEDGFKGSYYEGVVISQVEVVVKGKLNKKYIVQYRTLQTDDLSVYGRGGPLREFRSQHEIRPSPPQLHVSSDFSVNDKVDAYYNDGWWIGVIKAIKASQYFVYFDYTDEVIAFSFDDLRFHQEWVDDHYWVISRKRGRPKKY